jgi:orotidine-5'-phosphate decarboxylase
MKDVIIACDFKNRKELVTFLSLFESEKPFLKIGMELFYREGPLLVKELKEQGYKIFLDLKLHDIPTTIKKSMRNLGELGVDIVNVHAAGGIKMMQAAKEGLIESKSKALLVAVTQLTSISNDILNEELLIPESIETTVKHYALNIKKAGLDGAICSPLEAGILKDLGLISVTPGIRFSNNDSNDQVRISTPKMAKELGSDYIVVGRSITQSQDPLAAYQLCVQEFGI